MSILGVPLFYTNKHTKKFIEAFQKILCGSFCIYIITFIFELFDKAYTKSEFVCISTKALLHNFFPLVMHQPNFVAIVSSVQIWLMAIAALTIEFLSVGYLIKRIASVNTSETSYEFVDFLCGGGVLPHHGIQLIFIIVPLLTIELSFSNCICKVNAIATLFVFYSYLAFFVVNLVHCIYKFFRYITAPDIDSQRTKSA